MAKTAAMADKAEKAENEGTWALPQRQAATSPVRTRRARSPLQPRAGTPFLRGALEALLVPLAFAWLGLSWWGGVDRVAVPQPSYASAVMTIQEASGHDGSAPHADAPRVWLVDGFNVVQVGLLRGRDRERWWGEARRLELLERAARFEAARDEIWVVFDGSRSPTHASPSDRVHPVYAPSADRWLVERVRDSANPAELTVVTADRRLAERVRRLGARVVSPGDFLRGCGSAENGTPVRSV